MEIDVDANESVEPSTTAKPASDVIMIDEDDTSDFIGAVSASHTGKQKLLHRAKQDERVKANTSKTSTETDTESVEYKPVQISKCRTFMQRFCVHVCKFHLTCIVSKKLLLLRAKLR